jgi:serine/threonine protein kinase
VEVFEFLVNYFPKGMNDELAQHVLEQILVAVECLHQENIIHRDLKLENVLLSVDDVFF